MNAATPQTSQTSLFRVGTEYRRGAPFRMSLRLAMFPVACCASVVLVLAMTGQCRGDDKESFLVRFREHQQLLEASIHSLHFVEQRDVSTPGAPYPGRYEDEWFVDRNRYLRIEWRTDPVSKKRAQRSWQSYDGEHYYELLFWSSEPGKVQTIQRSREKRFPHHVSRLLPLMGIEFPGLPQSLGQSLEKGDPFVDFLSALDGTPVAYLRFGPTQLTSPGFLEHRLRIHVKPSDLSIVQYLIFPARVTDEDRHVNLEDGEAAINGSASAFQQVKDDISGKFYRFPREVGLSNQLVTIDVLEINPKFSIDRFRPTIADGIEFIDDAGSVRQTIRVAGDSAAKNDQRLHQFAEDAASQGTNSVVALTSRPTYAINWFTIALLTMGSSGIGVLGYFVIRRVRNS